MPVIFYKNQCLETTDEEFAIFADTLKYVKAGGGIVRNRDGQYLMIFRNGRWDLPKGHLEEGEEITGCALREVTEETGLNNLEIGRLISVTHHIYALHGNLFLKETSWFSMQYNGTEIPVPQTEEGIEKVVWVSEKKLIDNLDSSYASLQSLAKKLVSVHR